MQIELGPGRGLPQASEAPNKHMKDWHIGDFSPDPGSSKNRPERIGYQSWKEALRQGTACDTPNFASGKYPLTFTFSFGPEPVPPLMQELQQGLLVPRISTETPPQDHGP